jgi:fructose-1,6-bisphosphatase/inositol monophosphatase family enzyme
VNYDVDRVGGEIREAATHHLRPRFRALRTEDVWEKSPGEVVTVADQECERALSASLCAAVPGSVVIGEEAAAENPTLLRYLSGERPVWLLDPLDGTSAFATGSPDYGVMAALVVNSETVLGIIHQPEHSRTFVAEQGAGACEIESGERLAVRRSSSSLEGAVKKRFLPVDVRAVIERNESRFGTLEPRATAASIEYPALARGDGDFMLYWRTLPWDHAPGALLLREAGGVVARLDGAAYDPTDRREGLLAAGSAEAWREAKSALGLESGTGSTR